MACMRRLLTFFAMTAVFTTTYVLASTTEVPESEADKFMEEFNSLVEGIDAAGIFIHNATIAAAMFVPGAGVVWGLFSAWSTGYAFAAITTATPELSAIPSITILLTPFGLLELAAYSLAMSRSVLFLEALLRSRPARGQIRPLVIDGGVVAALLAAAATIEWAAIGTMEDGMTTISA